MSPHTLPGHLRRIDVAHWIIQRMEMPGRCLIGIDCNFAYAENIGLQQFGVNYTYLDLWRAVEESSCHLPDYFAAGFWEHEIYGKFFWHKGTKPPGFDAVHQRLTELTCREKGHGHPESPFKLIGPKQVGKGGLAGMRLLYDLKRKFGEDICIWPFEDHVDKAKLVLVEIYPRLFLRNAGYMSSKIRGISVLNQALGYFKADPIETSLEMTDHMTDAIISAVGLRMLAADHRKFREDILRPEAMSELIASREGWILGV